ncbi:MAG TPA: NAD-dependent epimerase/dehydratase family protein [Nannocystis sp.]
MSNRVLVTGASGFIGSHLVEALHERGQEVRAMVRSSSKLTHLEACGAQRVHAALDDVEAMAAAMAGVEIVYHVAGLTAAFNRVEFDRANAAGTANVFAAARRAGVRRVVYVSSLMAAGPSHADVARREHHAHRVGFTAYGDSKLGGERIAWEAARSGQVEAVIVRPPLVYGPRDTDVLQMIKSANAGIIAQPGLGRPAWLSAIHALDLVQGIALAGERGVPLPSAAQDPHGEHVLAGHGAPHDHVPDHPDEPAGRGIYYFTDGGQHTVTSFGRVAATALGRKAMALRFPGPAVLTVAAVNTWLGKIRGKAPALSLDKARGSLSPGWWCDDGKAVHTLGYRPQYPLEQGLEHTVRWLRDARWL